jgi:hypothetical protein
MTNSEYQELVEFLGRKFSEVDARFESVDGRLVETRRHFDVVAEGLRGDIRQVAEGVVNLNEKLDREMTALRQEMRTEFGEVKSMLKFSYTELDRRIRSLEEGFGALQARIEAVEARQS